jgi:hypothetical protein
MWRYLSRDCCIYIYQFIGALTLYIWYTTGCALTSTTTFMRSTVHKNIKKIEKIKNSLKKWRFCHARYETVTHGTSKVYQFITIKLQRFWHHRDLCSRVEKESNRDDRHTQTHTHTPIFFIALSCSETSITSRKVIKSGGSKILFFAWNQYFGILMRAEVIKLNSLVKLNLIQI